MPKSKLTYEQFVQQYRQGNRDELDKQFPKFAAKFNLLDGRGALRDGATVFVIQRKHSRQGYGKALSLYSFAVRTDAGYHATAESPALQPLTLTYNVARLMGYSVRECNGHDVIWTDDYAQEFVAHLSQSLFGTDKASALRCEVL